MVRDPVDRITSQLLMRKKLQVFPKHQKASWTVEALIRADFNALKKKLGLMGSLMKPSGNRKALYRKAASELFSKKTMPCLYDEDYMNVVWGSLYAIHLTRFLEHFPKQHLLVMKSEDFFQHPVRHVEQALDFLAVDSSTMNLSDVTSVVYNAGTLNDANRSSNVAGASSRRAEELPKSLTDDLRDFFEPFNMELERMFRIDTSSWS